MPNIKILFSAMLLFFCCTTMGSQYKNLAKLIIASGFDEIEKAILAEDVKKNIITDDAFGVGTGHSITVIMDGIEAKILISENNNKLIMLCFFFDKIKDQKLFFEQIIGNLGVYQDKIIKTGYRVIATKEPGRVISFMYEKPEKVTILVGD